VRREDLDVYRCPSCREKLALELGLSDQPDPIETGILVCQNCGLRYQIVNGIPRFVPSSNYANSFGMQWHSFPKTQLDDDWQQIYRDRFFQTTNFPQDLRGQTLLEVGCGAGAFSGIILSTGARLFSSDLSAAVDVCKENLRNSENLQLWSLSQADLHALPFASGTFDKVVCLGVIQHCPSPERAFRSLCQYLRPGGEIVIDCYLKQPLRTASRQHLVKHALRVVTKRMPGRLLMQCIALIIGGLYELKAMINRIPLVGTKLHRLIAIGELKRRNWTPEQMKQIKTMNVFDMLSPKYDNPQSLETVRGWITEQGLQFIKCDLGHNGVNAKARKPIPMPVDASIR
jgi:2-polyprenyl-3-methyl-5-hydroxy-6-metoxy-1,4-benzoquinol methylase/uncharacterized protein YbaR (Trm112 family)